MDKLRAALAQHGRWAPLADLSDRMQSMLVAHLRTALAYRDVDSP